MATYFPMGHDDGIALVAGIEAMYGEQVKQTAILAAQANTSIPATLLKNWASVREAIQGGYGQAILPVGSQYITNLADDHTGTTVNYDAPWDSAHFGTGMLPNGNTINVMFSQMHYCLPFDTMFSQYQAFLKSVDGLPADTYNVTFASDAGDASTKGKTFYFTLPSDLPAGGLLAGFRGYSGRDIYIYQNQTDTSPTTVTATEGSEGTSLGTITVAGVFVPASGTPESTQTVTVDGTDYHFYGLNSVQRIAYGNGRWLHSPLRKFLNAYGTGWYAPATVFDVPPSYVGYKGFLTMLPEEFVASMQPIAQVTALNYVTDGGTAASPLTDTTYDKVFLPSWEQHYLAVSQYYGGAVGLEGQAWDYWKQVAGTSSPLPASTWGNESTYHKEYIQYDLASKTTARTCWVRSALRGTGSSVADVYSSGNCGSSYAISGYRVAPACAIG